MRTLLTLVIAVHAALHLLGVAKSWTGALFPQLAGKTLGSLSAGGARAVGALWFSAASVLLAAAALRLLRDEDWWLVAAIGVVLSQGLIVVHWADAKAGTLPNVVIAFAVVVAAATTRFKGDVYDDVRSVLAGAAQTDSSAVRPGDLERLPQPVRRWLIRSGVVGKPRARAARLIQRGEIRTSPDYRSEIVELEYDPMTPYAPGASELPTSLAREPKARATHALRDEAASSSRSDLAPG